MRNFVMLKVYVEVICISYALKFVPEVIYKSCEYNIITLQKKESYGILLPKIENFSKKECCGNFFLPKMESRGGCLIIHRI